MVNILENSTFSIAAHCDKTCQICDYGAIGELFPQQGANNCSNIVIQQLVNETATYVFFFFFFCFGWFVIRWLTVLY